MRWRRAKNSDDSSPPLPPDEGSNTHVWTSTFDGSIPAGHTAHPIGSTWPPSTRIFMYSAPSSIRCSSAARASASSFR
eukprot:1775909-Lingulodinium_polyedra.AAC.1